MLRTHLTALALAGLLSSALPTPCSAQTGNAAAAEALFDQARSAMEHEEYEEACTKFRESNRLDPAAGTLLNLGNCEELRGNLATAWELFRAVEAQLPPGDDCIPEARDRAAKLKPRLPRLPIDAGNPPPDGMEVKRDGVVLGSA